jgi:HK97 gp10 family phage protein
MADRVTLFKITGVKEIRWAFRHLEPNVARKVIRQAVRKGLAPIRAAALRHAPLGKTGLLRSSIKIRAFTKRKRGVIGLEIRVGEGDYKGVTYYAAFQEYGTAKMPASPFMRPAFDTEAVAGMNLARKLIRDGIVREVAALRRTP